ncbi:PadR family transcriptional regulator [Hyphomonas sp.]|uniref:PadR family transcriptional regulator n=1 Tax=Hyphomonas sp. TaxID=87 RepID=UPI0039E2813A
MTDIDTAFVKKVFDISKRERKPNVHHYAKLDDLGRGFEIAERVLGLFPRLTALPYSLKPCSPDNTAMRDARSPACPYVHCAIWMHQETLMALRNAILVSLSDGPMSGYDLAKHFDETIGFFWRATHSQIYRELAKLKEKGLVTSENIPQRGKPNRILYSISNAGRDRLLDWSRTPSMPDPVKDDFLVRLYGLEHMDIDALREHLVQRLETHKDRLAKFTEIAEASDPQTIGELGRLRGLEIGLRYEREWAKWCEETLVALSAEKLGKFNKVVRFEPTKRETKP